MSAPESALDRAIRLAGGLSALGRKLSKPVSHEAVRRWRDGVVPLSLERAIQIEEALQGKVRRRELLPAELFDEPVYPSTQEHPHGGAAPADAPTTSGRAAVAGAAQGAA